MNQIVHPDALRAARPIAPEQEAGPRPYRWTASQLLKASELGLFGDRRVELIDGELFEMPGEGPLRQGLRELIQNELVVWFYQNHPGAYVIGTNGPIRLDDENEPEPDIYVRSRAIPLSQVRGADSLLTIEIASTSHGHDFGRKAPLYARFGARELWIIDAVKRLTVVHRGPSADGSWREIMRIQPERPVYPEAFEGYEFLLAKHLADLGDESA